MVKDAKPSLSPPKALAYSTFTQHISNVNIPGANGFGRNHQVSYYVISFSHNYTMYAFCREGNGEAEFCIGHQPERNLVDRSWNKSRGLKWGDKEILTLEVAPDDCQEALNWDNQITC